MNIYFNYNIKSVVKYRLDLDLLGLGLVLLFVGCVMLRKVCNYIMS